jgi:hypothetical protein
MISSFRIRKDLTIISIQSSIHLHNTSSLYVNPSVRSEACGMIVPFAFRCMYDADDLSCRAPLRRMTRFLSFAVTVVQPSCNIDNLASLKVASLPHCSKRHHALGIIASLTLDLCVILSMKIYLLPITHNGEKRRSCCFFRTGN